ncbi:UNVERIFIED_CONTAM: hypothetical protein FKN15_000994 [Acipenser sinensis]
MVQSENSSAASGSTPNPSILLALRLASHHDSDTERGMLARLQVDAVKRVQEGLPFSSGTVALYCLAMQASCADPSITPAPGLKGGKKVLDLRKLLEKKLKEEIDNIDSKNVPLTNYYQVSLDILALCMMGRPVTSHTVQRLIEASDNGGFSHGEIYSVDSKNVPLTNYYQVSLDILALCMMGRPVTSHTVQRLIEASDNGGFSHGEIYSVGDNEQRIDREHLQLGTGHAGEREEREREEKNELHSCDNGHYGSVVHLIRYAGHLLDNVILEVRNYTASVAVLALTCVKRSIKAPDRMVLRLKILNALKCLIKNILQETTSNGLIGNIYSSGLAMQALSVTSTNYDCSRTIQTLLERAETLDGSVLPLAPPTAPEGVITVHYRVEDDFHFSFNDSIEVMVPVGSSLLQVMEEAAKISPAKFRHEYSL